MSNHKLKGGIAIMAIGFVLLLALLFVFVIKWSTDNNISKVKIKVETSVLADDSGTWIPSFLSVTKNGTSYMEAIGSSSAENHEEYIKQILGSIENSLETQKDSKRSLSIPGKIKIGEAPPDAEKFFVDIPFPGGGRGVMEVRGSI